GLAGPSGDLLPLVDPRTARGVRRSGDDGRALGTVRIAGELVVASGHITAVVEELDAIGEGVLHRVSIEVLVHRIAAVVAAAQSLRFHGPRAFDPGTFVDLMDEVI